MNATTHKQVRAWLESEDALDSETEAALQTHLQTCADCRAYAEMIAQLKEGSWNPFPRQRLTQAELQKIVNQIRPQLRRNSMTPKAGFFNLSSALGLVGLIAIVGLFALMIAQLNQTAVSPAAPSTQSEAASYTWYDGWETGVAFQFPATWTIANFDTDDSSIITFATPLNETAAPCSQFMPSDSNAGIWIAPFDETMPLTPVEFLDRFIEFDAGSVQDTLQAVTVNGRAAAYTRSEVPCEEPFNQVTIMTAETGTHHVLLSTRHTANGAAAARTELEAIITSLTSVDYTGWQPWRPGEFNYIVMAPVEWNVFDALKSLELTTSSQPMWSSFAVPDQPANPLRMILFHNLNNQFGRTPLAVVEQHIAQMEAELTMQQVEPPTAHPLIPELVTAVYTTEDTAVFFGAIAYPHESVSLDPIGATATVPLDQLDSFGDTFERVLRSLNGYYSAILGVSVRTAITGSNLVGPPTATPIPPTSPAPDEAIFATPTPTAVEFSTDSTVTATPFPPTLPAPGEATPTPTPIDFSTILTPMTPTPIHTATPIPFLSPTP